MLIENRTENNYQALVQAAITRLQKMGFHEFKADIPTLEKPAMFVNQQDEDKSFMPDLSMKRGQRNGYVEFATTGGDVSRLVQKWKLLSRMAVLKNKFFMILAPKGTITFTKRLLKEHAIDAKMVRLA